MGAPFALFSCGTKRHGGAMESEEDGAASVLDEQHGEDSEEERIVDDFVLGLGPERTQERLEGLLSEAAAGGSLSCACAEPEPTVSSSSWNDIVNHSLALYGSSSESLSLPWEQGILKEILGSSTSNVDGLRAPRFIPEFEQESLVSDAPLQLQIDLAPPVAPRFHRAVKSDKDLEYFEMKKTKIKLACAHWLKLLSINWQASSVGPQVAVALQEDATGLEAEEILTATFGVKSPATLLKRASALRRYCNWLATQSGKSDTRPFPLALVEEDVWRYFLHLKAGTDKTKIGFTVQSEFLETIRFAKFVLGFSDCNGILSSRRLVGYAAIQRQRKGPTEQAPPLSEDQVLKLHEVLRGDSNIVDRVGAGCMLVCVYGRAGWSDLRFIHHAVLNLEQHDAGLELYTLEHKTSAVGLRREQYLPLVIPREGICNEDWLEVFHHVYSSAGLDLYKVPLGPLMPAPSLDGGWMHGEATFNDRSCRVAPSLAGRLARAC